MVAFLGAIALRSVGVRPDRYGAAMAPDETPEPGPRDEQVRSTPESDVEAHRVLWPWIARRTRLQVISLVVISVLALAPIVALVSIVRSDPTPVKTLIDAPEDVEATRVRATVMDLSPSSGELRTRISVAPAPELLSATGRLNQPLSVLVNGAQGLVTRGYLEGETITPFDVSLPLARGSTTRYPFDSYEGALLLAVTLDIADDRREPEPFVLEVQSVVENFRLGATRDEAGAPGAQSVSGFEWTADRPATTTIYAVWLMLLMWGLAVTGLLIVGAIVVWMVEIPFWCFGYFVGVLFALPNLRDSLPGRPPPGTIFDFGSFYWAVTIIGVDLILLLSIWLRRTHLRHRLQTLDPTPDQARPPGPGRSF